MSVAYRAHVTALGAVTIASARAYLQTSSAYAINLIRWPLTPIFTFATWRVTYSVSGRAPVEGAAASGFLLVGIFGMIVWTSSIWASGYAMERERDEGTSASLFLTPASRAAVVAGHGLGSFVWFLPSFAALTLLALATGATFHAGDPLAVLASITAIFTASLAAGFAFSGLFILSRKANLIANVLQSPAYLLSGLLVPLALLPPWLRPLSSLIPVTYAVSALRASMLGGAGMMVIGHDLVASFLTSAAWFAVGLITLRLVEHVAKHTAQLDLF